MNMKYETGIKTKQKNGKILGIFFCGNLDETISCLIL